MNEGKEHGKLEEIFRKYNVLLAYSDGKRYAVLLGKNFSREKIESLSKEINAPIVPLDICDVGLKIRIIREWKLVYKIDSSIMDTRRVYENAIAYIAKELEYLSEILRVFKEIVDELSKIF